jgi:hypothetical protein
MLNITVHPGSAHSAFLRAGPRVPTVETEARRPRAPQSGRGRDAARRSEPSPTRPASRGDPAVGPPLSAVARHPLKGFTDRQPIFFSPALRSSRLSTSKRCMLVPIAQASTSPVFHHRSPSSAPDSVRVSPPSGPPPVSAPLSCSFP